MFSWSEIVNRLLGGRQSIWLFFARDMRLYCETSASCRTSPRNGSVCCHSWRHPFIPSCGCQDKTNGIQFYIAVSLELVELNTLGCGNFGITFFTISISVWRLQVAYLSEHISGWRASKFSAWAFGYFGLDEPRKSVLSVWISVWKWV